MVTGGVPDLRLVGAAAARGLPAVARLWVGFVVDLDWVVVGRSRVVSTGRVVVKAPSLDELRTQARRTYRYWPLYLLLRLREVEQHLTSAQRDELGAVLGAVTTAPSVVEAAEWDIALLVEYGLLQGGEPLPTTAPPAPLRWIEGECRGFVVNAAALEFSLETAQQQYRVALLRTTNQHSAVLQAAATVFNQIALELSPPAALEAAQVWAALHGARALDWQMHPLEPTLTSTVTPALPPRRRGRGFFRTPTS